MKNIFFLSLQNALHNQIKSNQSDREFIFSKVDDQDVIFEIKSHDCRAFTRIHLSPSGISLCEFLQDLGMQALPWSGAKTWDSFEDDLHFRATCSVLGTVEMQAEVRSTYWNKEEFDVKASIHLDLGGLPEIANDARKFFPSSRDVRL